MSLRSAQALEIELRKKLSLFFAEWNISNAETIGVLEIIKNDFIRDNEVEDD